MQIRDSIPRHPSEADVNDTEDRHTDWKAIIAAAGFFYVSLTGASWLFGEYILGRVREHIEDHTVKVTGERTRIFVDVERRAEGAISRISQLEQNCAVMQRWSTGVDTRLDGLEHWRSECSQKMAGIKQYIERDAMDISKIEDRLDRVEGLVSKGRRE